MNNKLIRNLYKLNLKKLKNKGILHEKIIICFSGIPSSGKSSIAKILEEKYKGIRIDNNPVRKYFINLRGQDSFKYADEVDAFVKEYLDYFLEKYNFPNKFFILDSSIDRKYNRIKEFADKNGFRMFVIRIDLPKRIAQKRAFERKGGVDPWFLKNIGRWMKEYKQFNTNHKPDVIINTERKPNLNSLFKKIDSLQK